MEITTYVPQKRRKKWIFKNEDNERIVNINQGMVNWLSLLNIRLEPRLVACYCFRHETQNEKTSLLM